MCHVFFVFLVFIPELDNIAHNHFLLVSPKEMPRTNEHINYSTMLFSLL